MNKLLLGLTVLVLVAGIAGCGTGEAPARHESSSVQGYSSDHTGPHTEETQQKQKITVYYADSNLMGLVSEEREITFRNEQEKYRQAISLLQHPAQSDHFPLWQGFAYHSVAVNEEGQLTIDAKGTNSYNLGSSGEKMAMDSLLKTLFQFPEVKSIRITVDGKPADSLMGHVEIMEPFSRPQ